MRSAIALLLVYSAISAGCATSSVVSDDQGAHFRWLTGELETSLPDPVNRATSATLRAFEDLGIVAVDNAVYGPKGKITGRMADGTEVRVRLRSSGSGGTGLAIRVGQIGDESVARQVLRHIEKEAEELRGGGVEKRMS